jgi:PTH2 family peptidyl-tRNA hydrolase
MYATFDSINKVKQVIVMRTKYPDGKGGTRKLRTGKMIAQGSHASMAWLTNRFRNDLCIDNDNPKEAIIGYRTWRTTPFSLEEHAWISEKFTKVTVYVETEEELLDLYEKAQSAGLTAHLIQDAGDTDFGGVPTYTALGIGPHDSSKLDPITGHLPLL